MKRDHDFVKSLIDEFFLSVKLHDYFNIFYGNKPITGWETWLQIEFAYFLSHHSSTPEWDREIRLEFDGRREREKINFRPDFILRKKGWATSSYAALEIKQDKNPIQCINKMIFDLDKVSKIRPSQLNMRSYWALGISKAPLDQSPIDFLHQYVELNPKLASANVIGSTNLAYYLF
ncbi:hypothetical protein [Nitrosomonas sp. Nm33]|uniref:hypothetical protein n=1 Tax=Nitrosomonas sp. Nm33 TaxID=133724 RepID=UPI00089A8312|nr:hypothetical protein [Nitrosomonas sp. Nm33]SDZ05266.1 hypothetical protein SAMN05421755_10949 [Nitrosomonas sp. Nm33]